MIEAPFENQLTCLHHFFFANSEAQDRAANSAAKTDPTSTIFEATNNDSLETFLTTTQIAALPDIKATSMLILRLP